MSPDRDNKYWSGEEPWEQNPLDHAPSFDTGTIQKELDMLLEERRKRREQQLLEELEQRTGRQEPVFEEPLEPQGEPPAQDARPEPPEDAPRKSGNRADIKEVRAFVQTSFDDSFGEAEQPPEEKFVVQLPEEVYRIGLPEQPASDPTPSPEARDDSQPISYEEYEARYEGADEAPDFDRSAFHEGYEESLEEQRPARRGLFGRMRDRVQQLLEDDDEDSLDEDEEDEVQPYEALVRERQPEQSEQSEQCEMDSEQVTLSELVGEQPQPEADRGQTVIIQLPVGPRAPAAQADDGTDADYGEADYSEYATQVMEAIPAAGQEAEQPEQSEQSEEVEEEEEEGEAYDEALERRISLAGLFQKGEGKARSSAAADRLDGMPAAELAALLNKRSKSIDSRSRLVGLLAALQILPWLLWQLGPMQQPALAATPWYAVLAAALLGLQLALGYDVFAAAAQELQALRPGFGCMVSLTGLLAVLQALLYGRQGAVILTVYPALLHGRWMFNRRATLRKARIDSKLVCSEHVKKVPLQMEEAPEDPARGPARTILYGSRRPGLEGYFGRSLAPNPAERFAPLFLACTLVATVLFAGLNRVSDRPLPLLSLVLIALCCMMPLGLLICCDKPFAAVSDQLRRRGATLAGAPGMKELSRTDEVLLSDADLFGNRPPVIAGVKLYNGYTIEDAVLTTASLAQFLELPLQRALLAMIDNRDDRLMSMTEVRHLEGAGVQAYINGNVAVLGTEAFLRHETVSIRKDEIVAQIEQSDRVPLYLAIGGHLAAVFSVEYDIAGQTAELCGKLAESGVGLVVATMDPLLTGKLVELVAGLPRGSVRTIPQRLRKELEAQTDKEQPVKGAANSSSPLYLVRMVLGAVSAQRASVLGLLASVCAMAAGTFLSAALIRAGNFEVADLAVLLLFQLAWLLPVWCAGFIANKKLK